jgi:thiol:disulfide interchange protein DsbC
MFTILFFSMATWADPTIYQDISDRLRSANEKLNPTSIRSSKVPGIFEVFLASGEIVYTNENADFLLVGELYKTQPGGLISLTEEARKAQRLTLLETVEAGESIDFSPQGTPKASVFVFTDISCPYCRKLHREMPKINDLGIEIRYLAYPRAGVNSTVYRDMVSIWCSDDPQKVMTDAKGDKPIKKNECENPVAKQYRLGGQVGITGTPSLILSDGSIIPGFVTAERLASHLGLK